MSPVYIYEASHANEFTYEFNVVLSSQNLEKILLFLYTPFS